MSVADKSRGPYKQFFACECGSRFNNEDELKIHFCLSHHGEKEVKVKVQRIYKNSESPKKIKNEAETPATPGSSNMSPVKTGNATPNKNQMKIVSVQEENNVRVVTQIKEEKTGYRKALEDLNKYARRTDAIPAPALSKPSYRTIQYPKSKEGVTLYKSEPLAPNVVHTSTVQKKSMIKPIVIPISQMKPNSYVIQQPVKKQPADTNIQVFKCGDNKFLVRNNSPVKNVSLQQSGGKPVYVINGPQDGQIYQNVIVQHNPTLQMETDHGIQYVGIKQEQETYQEYVVESQSQQYVEKEEQLEQEVEYEQGEYPAEYVNEEYITGDAENESENDGEVYEEYEEVEDGEEGADYENMLEAHEVGEPTDVKVKEVKPKKKYRHRPAEGGSHQCPICARSFGKPMSLTQHMIQVHRPTIIQTELVAGKKKRRAVKEKVEIKCDLCDREFFGTHALAVHRVKAHLGTEHIIRPYQCELCEKAYRNQTLLTYHMRTHTGDRPYKCTYCPKAFTMGQGLQSHLNTHTGDRWFECKTCHKRLKSSYALSDHQKWHLRVHTGERPEQCRKCDKRFKCQTALVRHEKVHTGDKPYACPHCNKCFSQSNSMKLHVITVHMKLPSPYKSHHNRYRKRREKMMEKQKEAEMKKEAVEEEQKEEEMEVYFGSEDDAAGYEEVYA